jgi:hypothetical protein
VTERHRLTTVGTVGVIALAACAAPAYAQTTLVLVRQLDHVEHLNLLGDLWKPVALPQEKSFLSQQNWPELKISTLFIGGATIAHLSSTGFEDKAIIEAPVSYTVCHAALREPAVTCNGSLIAVYRIATDHESNKIDGIHYTIAYSQGNPASAEPPAGKCWVSGTIIVTFVLPDKRSTFKCGQTGAVAFQFPTNDNKDETKKKQIN